MIVYNRLVALRCVNQSEAVKLFRYLAGSTVAFVCVLVVIGLCMDDNVILDGSPMN